MNATRRMSILLTALALWVTTVTGASAQLTTATLSGRCGILRVAPSRVPRWYLPAKPAASLCRRWSPTRSVSSSFQTSRLTPTPLKSRSKDFRRSAVLASRFSGGDRSSLGGITLEVGGVAESVTVTAEAALVQSQSGERSFTVTTNTVESLPIANRSFTILAALAPGVTAAIGGNVNAGIQPNRIGGGGAPNILMDGVSTMDVASNGPRCR